jgi:NAD(P)H dehydrogenase (quinone)
MRVLIVYCHPCPESFSAALLDTALVTLKTAGHETRLIDLYAEGFDPVMSAEERRGYHTPSDNEKPVAAHLENLRWCEGLLFIYPTWWYGQPAMLKGWMDRVWVPHATFTMPKHGQSIRAVMTNIRLLGVITTLGAPWWWWTFGIEAPGRKILLRGLRPLIGLKARTFWLGLHEMDSASDTKRKGFLVKVAKKLARI